MPCWYFEKKELLSTPSFRDGIGSDTEAIYRREGARFIIDAGTKMGLRYDTCATGVVYFHRFYLFHSFKEFNRYVTAACCLFLAGKVEETPKKCKDLIKVIRAMLNDEDFAAFGQDPREEVMTLERILLQTIKFDLMVEHPYAYMLKFAKIIKGDKTKVQKMVQMAWTFVNDSLCTTLCLQWEPEVIAISMMYLTSKLSRCEIVDWQGKPSGYKGKWFEFFVEDVTLDLLEEVCHQVLDLYSKPTTSKPVAEANSRPQPQHPSSTHTPTEDHSRNSSASRTPQSPQVSKKAVVGATSLNPPVDSPAQRSAVAAVPPSVTPAKLSTSYSETNPYVATQNYLSSFMNTEGTQSIQSLIGGGRASDDRRSSSGGSSYHQKVSGASAAYPAPQQAAAYLPPSQAAASNQLPAAAYSYPQQPQSSGSYTQQVPSAGGYIQQPGYSQQQSFPPQQQYAMPSATGVGNFHQQPTQHHPSGRSDASGRSKGHYNQWQ